MELRPGYKQTEVGVIPEDWDVRHLEELGVWKGGGTPSMSNASYWLNGTIPWASSGDIKTRYISSTANSITNIAVKQSSTTLLPEGAILIVTRSGILRKYLPVAKNTVPVAINQDIKALISNGAVAADYVLHVLTERGPTILSTCMKAGTTVESVEYTWLKEFAIPFPPTKAEQEAIAAALSDVDALIASLDNLIAKKRDIKQATMHQLLTGKKRLPGFDHSGGKLMQTEVGVFPEDWESGCLGDQTQKVGSGITPTGGERVYKGEGRPFLRSQNVGWGTLLLEDIAFIDDETHKTFKATEIETGDVFLNITGASIGRSAIADARVAGGNVNQHVCIIRTNAEQIHPHLLKYFLLSSSGQRQIDSYQAGGNRQGLNFGQIRSFQLPIPPLPEQRAIAAVLSDMDAEITALEARRDKTRALKQGMMQELLTGRIRLV